MKKRDGRIRFLMLLLAGFGLAVLGRYAWLAFAPSAGQAAEAEATGERGRILDRNGRLLAMDTPLYDISIWKPDTDPDAFPAEAALLGTILGTAPESILARWNDRNASFFYLARRMSPQVAQSISEGKASGKFKGVRVDQVSGRLYPEGRLGSLLVGFTGEGNRGLEGIEKKYDAELAPGPRSATERSRAPDDRPADRPKGDDVVLTLDANLQYLLEEVGRKAMRDNKAEALMLLAMDVRTGAVLSYVSLPDFDPNSYGSFPKEAREDRPAVYSYEPGSVFKAYSLASILDLGGITPQTTFTCNGAYEKTMPSGEEIRIRCLGVHGKVDLQGILTDSCNSGTGYASDRVTEADLYAKLVAFGFGARTGVALSGESPGMIRDPAKWSGRTKPTIAMGQEILVTALQMTAAAAAIGNGGILMKPRTVERIVGADGSVVFEDAPQEIRRVVEPGTAGTILRAMESAATKLGTGWRAKVADVRMAVKTGTAQIIDTVTKRYSDTDFIASTTAIFPADDPQVALYVAIVKPKGSSYLGGQIAAPVIQGAAEAALSVLKIRRGGTPEVTPGGSIKVSIPEAPAIGDVMPDLKGTPKRLLLPTLARTDIKVQVRGDGYVVRQSPEPGAAVVPGTTIILELE